MEDIVQQHRARPIPNFFQLVKEGVAVDRILQDGDRVVLEPGLTLEVVGTPGHSADELSYRLCEKQVVFTGDAIPGRGDIPIYVDPGASLASLARLKALPRPRYYCPAWDQVYSGAQGVEVIQQGEALILRIQAAVEQTEQDLSLEAVVEQVCRRLGMEQLSSHPLFRRTVAGHGTPGIICEERARSVENRSGPLVDCG